MCEKRDAVSYRVGGGEGGERKRLDKRKLEDDGSRRLNPFVIKVQSYYVLSTLSRRNNSSFFFERKEEKLLASAAGSLSLQRR